MKNVRKTAVICAGNKIFFNFENLKPRPIKSINNKTKFDVIIASKLEITKYERDTTKPFNCKIPSKLKIKSTKVGGRLMEKLKRKTKKRKFIYFAIPYETKPTGSEDKNSISAGFKTNVSNSTRTVKIRSKI